jgi:hypothetical protein
MVVDFARNINKFKVNQYVQIVPVEKMQAYYLEMTVEEAGRIINTDLRNFHWPDASPAPEGNDGLESFDYKLVVTNRYAYPVLLGDLTIDQSSWDILAQHSRIKSQQAMTARTQLVANVLTTEANYDASHVLDVTAISGNTGGWDQSTTARMDIQRSLGAAQEIILDDTLSAVELDDLVMIISSGLANKLRRTQEIVDYVKSSPDALAQVRGELPGQNTFYGLPDTLYGIPLVVDATRKTTTKKGETTVRTSIYADDIAMLVARPGGLVGVDGAPSFSTVTLFAKEEMTVETKRDDDNRRTKARVVENIGVHMTAPAAGVLFTDVSS